jgi:hypothetical protein
VRHDLPVVGQVFLEVLRPVDHCLEAIVVHGLRRGSIQRLEDDQNLWRRVEVGFYVETPILHDASRAGEFVRRKKSWGYGGFYVETGGAAG